MHGDDLAWLRDGLAKLNAANQGMNYSSGDCGQRKYDEDTGEPYYTRARPAELTVYSDRAIWLYALIQRADELSAALSALSGSDARE